MNKTAVASLFGLLFSPIIFAADNNIQTNEVVVTASRTPQSRETVIADVTVITREEIERAGQSTFIELLQSQPGVEITSNGGAGKTSSVFLRGTNASHVLVLIDGIRVNSATAGTTTFENLPLAQIEKVEILRGPATSLYGQDAIGGVIQIFTRKGGGQPRFYAGVGYGTYDTKTADAGVLGSIGDTSFSLNVSSSDTAGFSSYKTDNPQFDDNDGYRNLAVTASLSHQIMQGHDIGVQFLSSEGHTHFDSRFNFTDFSDNADITQLSYVVTSHNQFTSNWLSTIRIGEGIDEVVNFSEVNFFNPVSRSSFKTKQRQYSWQNDIELPLGILTLLYDRLEERVVSKTEFTQTSRNNDGYVASYLANVGNHSLQASYRSDHNSQFGTNDTGNIGYGYKITPSWQISGSYGTAFKAPTFNDSFFPFQDFGFGFSYVGNPDLKPEKSRNREVSLRYQQDDTNASATIFRNEIRNLILGAQGIPADTAINIGSVTIEGLTLAASQRWDTWHLHGSIDIQSPRNDETDNLLIRRANRHASANLSREFGDWRFGAEAITSSARYNDQANTQRMAGYTIFNLTTDYKINQDWKLQARLNNLFDKNYALAFDGDPSAGGFVYDTPGSNLFVSVRFEPK